VSPWGEGGGSGGDGGGGARWEVKELTWGGDAAGALGKAAQVYPVKPSIKAPGTKHLK